MARDYDHLFKLLIIGDSGECLATAWLLQFVNTLVNRFDKNSTESNMIHLASGCDLMFRIELFKGNTKDSAWNSNKDKVSESESQRFSFATSHSSQPNLLHSLLFHFLCHQHRQKKLVIFSVSQQHAWIRNKICAWSDYYAIWWALNTHAFVPWVLVRSTSSSQLFFNNGQFPLAPSPAG